MPLIGSTTREKSSGGFAPSLWWYAEVWFFEESRFACFLGSQGELNGGHIARIALAGEDQEHLHKE
jgi:hypothetical protein